MLHQKLSITTVNSPHKHKTNYYNVQKHTILLLLERTGPLYTGAFSFNSYLNYMLFCLTFLCVLVSFIGAE